VIFLGIESVASLVVMLERWIVGRKARGESRAFAQKMSALLAKGDLDTAADAKVGKDIGYLGRVISAGLGAYKSSTKRDHDLTIESVARALERQSAREVQVLKRGHGLLATVGSTAPFVGLFGTVFGIITAFQLMAASGSGGLGTVSAGIAEALFTTAFGLFVAIPAVMGFNYFTSWVEARAIDMSESSNEFLDLVARNLAEMDETRGESAEAG
jgi:biopolymer transport protein ExbB/biopolymer transport protein TolQ